MILPTLALPHLYINYCRKQRSNKNVKFQIECQKATLYFKSKRLWLLLMVVAAFSNCSPQVVRKGIATVTSRYVISNFATFKMNNSFKKSLNRVKYFRTCVGKTSGTYDLYKLPNHDTLPRNVGSILGFSCRKGANQNITRNVRCFSADNQTKYSDIDNQKSWISSFPKKIQPYVILARVDRPIGTWLIFLPCTWSISLAADAGSLPSLYLLTLFGIGSILMRGSGCVINDLWDADLDKKVARTSTRPLACGEISVFQSLVFLGAQLSCALAVLLSLNNYSIVLGASSVVLAVIYPVMKRITFWPQIFLGATLNWGCLLGWSAVHGSLNMLVCLPLYVAAVNWTVIYDTIYSFQDVKDDQLVGIKSTALLFGDKAKIYLSGFAAIMIANLLLVGINSSQTWPYYVGFCGVSSHLAWQLSRVDLSQPKDCLAKFKSNRWLGMILAISIVASMLMKYEKSKDETIEQE